MPCLGWPGFCLSWLVCCLMFAMRCDGNLCSASRLYMFMLVCIGFCRRWLRQYVFYTLQICCGNHAKPNRLFWECWRVCLQLRWLRCCKVRKPHFAGVPSSLLWRICCFHFAVAFVSSALLLAWSVRHRFVSRRILEQTATPFVPPVCRLGTASTHCHYWKVCAYCAQPRFRNYVIEVPSRQCRMCFSAAIDSLRYWCALCAPPIDYCSADGQVDV